MFAHGELGPAMAATVAASAEEATPEFLALPVAEKTYHFRVPCCGFYI